MIVILVLLTVIKKQYLFIVSKQQKIYLLYVLMQLFLVIKYYKFL
jgi:hypothetical protein